MSNISRSSNVTPPPAPAPPAPARAPTVTPGAAGSATAPSLAISAGNAPPPPQTDAMAGPAGKLPRAPTAVPLASAVAGDAPPIELPPEGRQPLPQVFGRFVDSLGRQFPGGTERTWTAVSRAFLEVDPRLLRAGAPPSTLRAGAALGAATDPALNEPSGRTTAWDGLPSQWELWADGGPTAAHAQQGDVGSCAVLAAIAQIALAAPDLLQDPNFIRWDEATQEFVVTFHPLKWDNELGSAALNPDADVIEVRVSPELLEYDDAATYKDGWLVGSRATDIDGDQIAEIGVAVIEKAMALYSDILIARDGERVWGFSEAEKVAWFGADHGLGDYDDAGYDAISQGGYPDWAFMAITGQPMRHLSNDELRERGYGASQVWAILSQANHAVPVMAGIAAGGTGSSTATTTGWATEGLPSGHAYSVVGTYQASVGGVNSRFVVLRNPWGQGEDYPPGIALEPPFAVGSGETDGLFAIKFEDYMAYFDVLAFDEATYKSNIGTTDVTATYFGTDVAQAFNRFAAMAGEGARLNSDGTGIDAPHAVLIELANDLAAAGGLNPSGDNSVAVPSGSGAASGSRSESIQDRWSGFMADVATRSSGHVDIAAYVQFVLRESYNSTTQDLYFYAEKVKFFNDLKKMIREEVRQARTALSDLKNGDTSAMTPYDGGYWYSGKEFTYDHITTDENGNPSPEVNLKQIWPLKTTGDNATKPLEDYIAGLDKDLQAVGDDAQLANVDLQNILQKQQQTLQLMSNVSKMLYDTALAIIRKISG